MAAKVTLELSVKGFKKLSDFLDGREGDIAWDIEDFGGLKELFEAVFDEEPKKE